MLAIVASPQVTLNVPAPDEPFECMLSVRPTIFRPSYPDSVRVKLLSFVACFAVP